MIISTDFKLTFLKVLTLLVPIFLLCSCGDDDDIIWDMVPVNVMVNIQDTNGNNLLSPSVTGNLQGKKIVAEYQGQEYSERRRMVFICEEAIAFVYLWV